MRQYSLLLLSAIVLLISCKDKKEESHLSSEKMQEILIDIHYAEAYSTMVNDSLHQIKHKNRDSLAVFYADILNHHNVTPETFKKSMLWYENHPGELELLYAYVLLEATEEEGRLQKDLNNTKDTANNK